MKIMTFEELIRECSSKNKKIYEVATILNDEKDIVQKTVKDIMENTIKLNVPLEVDIEFGNNWYDAK